MSDVGITGGAASGNSLKELLLRPIDLAVEHRWEPALDRAEKLAHLSVDDRVSATVRSFQVELGGFGALLGGAAAAPGAGTAIKLGTTVADIGWVTGRLADLILTIAAIHGHDWATVEDRRMWVITVLAYGDGAAAVGKKLAGEMGKGLGKKATAKVPAATLRSFNKAAGRTILTKYGTKRGVVALGNALPFGIGAVIGGGANVVIVRSVGRHADSFMRSLAPPAIESGT